VRQLLNRLGLELREAGLESAEVEARLILAHVLGLSRSEFLTMLALGAGGAPGVGGLGEKLTSEQENRLHSIIAARKNGAPLQYIFGSTPFYGLEFCVGEGVFIPRPETEVLVEVAAEKAHTILNRKHLVQSGTARTSNTETLSAETRNTETHSLKIADLCSGTGAIAVSLAHELKREQDIAHEQAKKSKQAKVYEQDIEIFAVEKYEAAFSYLVKNVEIFEVTTSHLPYSELNSPLGRGGLPAQAGRTGWLDTDNNGWDTELVTPKIIPVLQDALLFCEQNRSIFDLIISNPPYVPKRNLPKDVMREPKTALFGGGENGMEFLYKLLPAIKHALKPGGEFIIEHDETQSDLVKEAACECGFTDLEGLRDLNACEVFLRGANPC
jgi:release factor glutamine methyltransferase